MTWGKLIEPQELLKEWSSWLVESSLESVQVDEEAGGEGNIKQPGPRRLKTFHPHSSSDEDLVNLGLGEGG